MGYCVCTGAITSCPYGLAPGVFVALPSMILTPCGPLATCINFVPFLNITPFGLCRSLANPITASLTAAAWGVLTPGACIPTPTGPWQSTHPTITTLMGEVLTDKSTINCAFGGTIKINMPGQFITMTTQ